MPPKTMVHQQCHHSALGGTFDHFHVGHMFLLQIALFVSKRVTVGLVQNPEKDNMAHMESYEERYNKLKSISTSINVVPLTDAYGPTLTDDSIDCVVASTETESSAMTIHDKRKERNMSSVTFVFVDTIPDHRHGGKVSSSTIRSEEAHK